MSWFKVSIELSLKFIQLKHITIGYIRSQKGIEFNAYIACWKMQKKKLKRNKDDKKSKSIHVVLKIEISIIGCGL